MKGSRMAHTQLVLCGPCPGGCSGSLGTDAVGQLAFSPELCSGPEMQLGHALRIAGCLCSKNPKADEGQPPTEPTPPALAICRAQRTVGSILLRGPAPGRSV